MNKKTYHIHFICIGNAYRSRLAETYLRSLQIPDIETSSSGLEAEYHRPGNGPVCWYALRIARKYDIIGHLSQNSIQTHPGHIKNADKIILMHRDVLDAFRKKFGDPPEHMETWDIDDVDAFIRQEMSFDEREKVILKVSEETFERIRKKVDKLVDR